MLRRGRLRGRVEVVVERSAITRETGKQSQSVYLKHGQRGERLHVNGTTDQIGSQAREQASKRAEFAAGSGECTYVCVHNTSRWQMIDGKTECSSYRIPTHFIISQT